jgi:hypothetical protein
MLTFMGRPTHEVADALVLWDQLKDSTVLKKWTLQAELERCKKLRTRSASRISAIELELADITYMENRR